MILNDDEDGVKNEKKTVRLEQWVHCNKGGPGGYRTESELSLKIQELEVKRIHLRAIAMK